MKHFVDLDLTVARTGPHDGGTGRVPGATKGSEIGEHAPEGITTKDQSCGEALRQNAESAVDFGDARRRFRRQGLARARAVPRERIRGAGRCGRCGRAPR